MHFVMEAQAVHAADARPGQGGDRQRKKARWQPRVSATYLICCTKTRPCCSAASCAFHAAVVVAAKG